MQPRRLITTHIEPFKDKLKKLKKRIKHEIEKGDDHCDHSFLEKIKEEAKGLQNRIKELENQLEEDNGTKKPALFIQKDFTMHSGGKGFFKIECDSLNNEELDTLALIGVKTIEELYSNKKIRRVHGIPEGGIRLAEAFENHIDEKNGELDLIVDDVYTTGNSMREARKELEWETPIGIVIFSRTKYYFDWIIPLFTMNISLDDIQKV